MSAGSSVAPDRSVIVAGLLFLSVAASIGASSYSRFNRNLELPDIGEYVSLERGTPLTDVPSPYRYRVIVPLIARVAPEPPAFLAREGDDAATRSVLFRFALVNVMGLAAAAWLLFLLMRRIEFGEAESLLGGLLLLASFPAISTATLPLVDAWAYALLAGALYALARRSYPLLFVLFAVGMFTKETTLLVPVAALLLPATRETRLRQALCLVPPLLAYSVFRVAFVPDVPTYSLASTQRFLYDTFVSGKHLRYLDHGVRAFGFVWLLAAYGWCRMRREEPGHLLMRWAPLLPLLLLIPFALALHVGRVWFFAFPVVIPLAIYGLLAFFRESPDKASPTEPAVMSD